MVLFLRTPSLREDRSSLLPPPPLLLRCIGESNEPSDGASRLFANESTISCIACVSCRARVRWCVCVCGGACVVCVSCRV
jgi:hypothetical protein